MEDKTKYSGSFEGTASCTALYLALVRYVSLNEGVDRSVDAKFCIKEGVGHVDLDFRNGLVLSYRIRPVGVGSGNSAILEEVLSIKYERHGSGVCIEDSINFVGPQSITKEYVDSFYSDIVSRCVAVMGLPGTVVGKDACMEWPEDDFFESERTPVIVNTPAQYLDPLCGEIESAFSKTPVYGVPARCTEYDEMLMELSSGVDALFSRRMPLGRLSASMNPVTGSSYSQIQVENKAIITLAACSEDMREIEYDRFIAVPPSMSMKIAFDFGSKDFIQRYLNVPQGILSDGERARLLHRLEKVFRKEVEIDVIERFLSERGKVCLKMAEFCHDNSERITVHELRDINPSVILGLFPQKGKVAFYTQYSYLLNETIEHLMDMRGELLSSDVADPARQVIVLNGLTVHFIGLSVRSAVREYMTGEHQVVRWRKTDSYRKVPGYADEAPSLDELLRDYVAQISVKGA